MVTSPLIIFGGSDDTSLLRLAAEAKSGGIDVHWIASDRPCGSLVYDPSSNRLIHNNRDVTGASAFYRMDVFKHLKSGRAHERTAAHAWYSTFEAWIVASAAAETGRPVRVFNQSVRLRSLNKPYVLARARQLGLVIPRTAVTNRQADVKAMAGSFGGRSAGGGRGRFRGAIVKPVLGGDYTQEAAPVIADTGWRNGLSAQPAIVQQRLEYPEYRVYRIGGSFVSLEVVSTDLDYRIASQYRLRYLPDGIDHPDAAIIYRGLRLLAAEMGIDFGAADLKTDPSTGEIMFLELNSMPMFAAYDRAAGGVLCRTILTELGHRLQARSAAQV